jgi:hypothetical protein
VALRAPLLHVVEIDDARDQEALDHHLPEGADAEKVGAVADRREQDRADEAATDRPPSAEQARAADNCGGDRLQLVAPCRRSDCPSSGGPSAACR